jgi:predicted ATPase/DNA-binding CsgD family transcriptional regulator
MEAVLHSRPEAAAADQQRRRARAEARALHDAVVAEAVTRAGGAPCGPATTGVVATFARPAGALAAAAAIHRALDGGSVLARIGVHVADEDSYAGESVVARCVRLSEAANGGQTLLSRAARDAVAGRADGALVDLGVHRLRDLGRPAHVFAIVDHDGPAALVPPRSVDVLPNNLPFEPTSFVGRARELAEVGDALAAVPLLTLVGAGGCGKTRLALHAAAAVMERFPGGVWYVALAALTDPAGVGRALAEAVGVRPFPGQDDIEAVVAALATGRTLVILDNCEHVLEAAAGVADALMRGCPDVTVLATSRAPLGLAAETTWRVPSLSLPAGEAGSDPAGLARSDAVRLFVDRAAQVRPGFDLDGETAGAVVAICRALDGIPLAIELAAARVRLRSPGQIAAGLSDRFHLLTGAARGALPRQRTLHASVDWSHNLLSDEERALFRRLAVFVDGFTLEAAEAVGADDPRARAAVLDRLTSLVDQSMVVADQRDGLVRYRLLETVREYALERLVAAGEEDAVRDRHARAFLALAEELAPALLTEGQDAALAGLDRDAGNLAAALARALTLGDAALRLCAALTHWWKLRGLFGTADAGFTKALAAADPTPTALRARVLWGRAYLLTYAGRYDEGIATAQDALAVADEVGDASSSARALDVLATMELLAVPLTCRATAQRARALARAGADHWCLVDATQVLAFTHLNVDEHDAGEALLEEVLPLIERMGYREFVSWHWCGMAMRPLARAEFPRLFDVAARGVAAARAVGEPVTEGVAQNWIAVAELAQGRAEEARRRLEACRELQLRTGAGLALALIETTLAAARCALGDRDAAREALEGVVATGADGGYSLALAHAQLADTLRVGGDVTGAERAAGDAIAVAEQVGSPSIIARAKEVLARVAAARGEWSIAEDLLHDALAARLRAGHELGMPQVLEALAEVRAGVADDRDAARLLGAARRARDDIGTVVWAPDRPALEAVERDARSRLGDASFDVALAEGTALGLRDAVAWVRRMRGSRKRPPSGWASLTPTELDVARHAAAGRTNPEIAAAMFISRATVKVHLSHIYAKLGLRNRAELAAAAVEHDADIGQVADVRRPSRP